VAIDVGFFGKLPSHGDFLRRRVSDAFVGVWDGWLQECLAASRAELGDRWLDVYLTSPAWRFACAAGACGPAPVAGVMVPSVDRVGRYFPLTLVAELPIDAPIVSSVQRAGLFFDAAERLVIETLESDHIDFDRFDAQLVQLGDRLQSVRLQPDVVLESAAAPLGDAADGWQIPIASAHDLSSTFEQMLTQRLSAVYEPMVLWWTDGSARVQPSCVIVKGLPHPDAFASLLDGSWAERRWRSITARIDAVAQPEMLVDDPSPPRFRSAAASDKGSVREINQDSFIERTDVGIWGVADGLGGHSKGEVASRMVCDALADVRVGASFEELIEVVRQRVGAVNDELIRAATRPVNAVQSGSTLVTLLARGSTCAVLWAGDSRAYRLRNGGLEQLTRDHSLAEMEGSDGADSHAITRAVGGEATLELDVVRDRVHSGDRFLLCSDGLTRTVPKDRLADLLGHEDIGQAVEELIKATLAAGAPDNVTALVVEAVPDVRTDGVSREPADGIVGLSSRTLGFGL
jgi:type VI secretion system protein ImpM